MPYVAVRNGTAHSPMKLMFTPESPTFTQKAAHVARFRTTASSPRYHGSVESPFRRPCAVGASCTFHTVSTASASDATPIATNTVRHDTTVIAHASGTVAAKAPAMPTTLAQPV